MAEKEKKDGLLARAPEIVAHLMELHQGLLGG